MPYFVLDKIELGPITFYVWGAFLGLAFLIGYLLFLNQAKKQGIEENKIFWLTMVILLGSILGARMGYVLQFPDNFSGFFQFNGGGLMFYGGLLGALVIGYFYIKKARLNFWQIADLVAPSLALGIFIIRLGCFLINDHQGALTNLFWAIQWPDGSLRHPIALYLALNGLIMFFVF
ncbi:MAG: prolipoprotein diacylglyceryl transferase family protein, partial [Patescibacteria group bacterium]